MLVVIVSSLPLYLQRGEYDTCTNTPQLQITDHEEKSLDSTIVKTQKPFDSGGAYRTNTMYHPRQTIKSNKQTVMIHRKDFLTLFTY